MLVSLTISNFTVVKQLALEYNAGFSVVTGETGAGKSITLDALGLCLGDRAEASKVRKGAKSATVSAIFNVSHLPLAQEVISDLGFGDEDDEECSIRRTVNVQGRSKAYINGHSATVAHLTELGQTLANICSQHAHHALLKSAHQRDVLDVYGQHTHLCDAMVVHYNGFKKAENTYLKLKSEQQQRQDREQLLAYQVQELDEFSPAAGEFETLEQEQKTLSHSSEITSQGQRQLSLMQDADGQDILSLLNQTHRALTELSAYDEKLNNVVEGCHNALVEIEEASRELRDYLDGVDLDPARLQEVEQRYTQYHDLSRKHNVRPEILHEHYEALSLELKKLQGDEASIQALELDLVAQRAVAVTSAEKLSQARKLAAGELGQHVSDKMHDLGMEGSVCSIALTPDYEKIGPQGVDNVSINIQTNPGEEPGPLHKIASGGELSRISLIIQLALAKKHKVATLLFDEVDVGISGKTAAIVGGLLQELGSHTQVISITHLPQVASYGEHHFYVHKLSDQDDKGRVATVMTALDEEERVTEIARLLGGKHTSTSALDNARALLLDGASERCTMS
jgi:DNA repair protein RecN (Recombination protein N)